MTSSTMIKPPATYSISGVEKSGLALFICDDLKLLLLL